MAGAVLLGLVLAGRPAAAGAAAPELEAARQGALLDRAADADAALAALEAELGPARDAARDGASLIVAGETEPQPQLEEAAVLMEAAEPEARAALRALDRLRGTAAAVSPGAVIPALAAPGELAGIAEQLRDAATAAGPFLERRLAAERTLERMADALAALRADDLATADRALDDARRARAVLAAWEPRPVTLPLWLQTTRQLIAAASDIARAAATGDPAAARAAARRYAAAAEEAHRADVSLALTLSETGSGLTATPLRRLADQLAALEDARVAVASLRSILA